MDADAIFEYAKQQIETVSTPTSADIERIRKHAEQKKICEADLDGIVAKAHARFCRDLKKTFDTLLAEYKRGQYSTGEYSSPEAAVEAFFLALDEFTLANKKALFRYRETIYQQITKTATAREKGRMGGETKTAKNEHRDNKIRATYSSLCQSKSEKEAMSDILEMSVGDGLSRRQLSRIIKP